MFLLEVCVILTSKRTYFDEIRPHSLVFTANRYLCCVFSNDLLEIELINTSGKVLDVICNVCLSIYYVLPENRLLYF